MVKFKKMKQSKLDYKDSIRKHKKDCELKFGEGLYQSLLDKDMSSFWKCWKSKFGKREAHAKVIEGCNDSSDISHVFKNYFMNNYIPNNPNVPHVYVYNVYTNPWYTQG